MSNLTSVRRRELFVTIVVVVVCFIVFYVTYVVPDDNGVGDAKHIQERENDASKTGLDGSVNYKHETGSLSGLVNLPKKSRLCKVKEKPEVTVYSGEINAAVTITFDDPRSYRGPVVEGWGPNVSRGVAPFLRPSDSTVLLEPKNPGFGPAWCRTVKLLIFQHSRPSGFAHRMDNRRTWMNYLREQKHIRAFFVVGKATGEKADLIQKKIVQEHEMYGDILQVDYVEHANNNTLKTLHAFKYILNVDWSGSFPDFVMKTDDDVYLNLPLLNKIVFERRDKLEKENGKLQMMGEIFIMSPVMRIEPELMNETYSDYLYVPSYIYNLEFYPTFTSGTGYLVPWWILPCIYQESQNIPYFPIEDVFIGGFVAERCKVGRVQLPGYSIMGPENAEKVGSDVDVLFHYVDHDLKHNIHRVITAGFNKDLEVSKR